MKINCILSVVLCILLTSCTSCIEYDQDCYVYNHTADSLYILWRMGMNYNISSKNEESNDFHLASPNRITHICKMEHSAFEGSGITLLILRKETFEELKRERFSRNLYDKMLYVPYSQLEANGFIIRIHDRDLK